MRLAFILTAFNITVAPVVVCIAWVVVRAVPEPRRAAGKCRAHTSTGTGIRPVTLAFALALALALTATVAVAQRVRQLVGGDPPGMLWTPPRHDAKWQQYYVASTARTCKQRHTKCVPTITNARRILRSMRELVLLLVACCFNLC